MLPLLVSNTQNLQTQNFITDKFNWFTVSYCINSSVNCLARYQPLINHLHCFFIRMWR